jgi:hypothetical protein
VAFDLFRYHLARALGLKLATTFKKERTQWNNLGEFWNAERDPEEFSDLDHSERGWPVPDTRRKEDGQ